MQIGRPDETLRVVFLWQRLSGYTHASFRALADLGVDVRVMHRASDAEYPFDRDAITSGLDTTAWTGAPRVGDVERFLDDADPHVVFMTSWHPPGYRRALRRRRDRSLRVLCMDNQWWGTPKQRLGVAASRLLIRPAFDAALVGSERGVDFAMRFGFAHERIIRGIYTADHDRFASVAERRSGPPARSFVFVGRLVPEKGIDVLAEGYRRYRRMVAEPWPLLVGGTGDGAADLVGQEGVEMLGFVQPDDLPAVLERAGCLVLPSRFEPWGVVVHEAAAAGLPIVCTRVCGAATRLVLDGFNGSVIGPDDPDALSRALARMSLTPDERRAELSDASRALAAQYTPARWAEHLVTRTTELRSLLGLADGVGSPAPAVGAPHPVSARLQS